MISDTKKKRRMFSCVPGYICVDDACAMTGFSRTTIYKSAQRRELPYYKIGKRIYFKQREVKDWFAGKLVRIEAVNN